MNASGIDPAEGYLLFILGTKLRAIVYVSLENDAVTLEDAKELFDWISKADAIAESLRTKHATDAKCLLRELKAELGRCDIPAQWEAEDGDNNAATQICTEAVERAYFQVGIQLKRVAAYCETIGADAFNETEIVKLSSMLGFDATELPIADLPRLEELLRCRPKRSAEDDDWERACAMLQRMEESLVIAVRKNRYGMTAEEMTSIEKAFQVPYPTPKAASVKAERIETKWATAKPIVNWTITKNEAGRFTVRERKKRQ